MTTLPAFPQGLAALRDKPNWVNWNLEPRAGDPKPTKVPYTPSLAGYASKAKAGDPATWGDYNTAEAAVAAGRFTGLGFEFHVGEGLLMLDLDGVIVGGKIAPIARAVMALVNSYAEPSVSDTGIRIVAEGELPRPHIREGVHGKKKGGFEIYGGAHFGTLTFRPFRGYEMLRRVDAETMERVFALLWPGDIPQQAPMPPRPIDPPPPIDLDDAALLEKAFASKNGRDFERRHSGVLILGNPSDDDFAYLGALRFWTQGDPGRMRRIALTSGRVRPKWESRRGAIDWLDYSITKALSEPHDVYDPSRASGKRIVLSAPQPDNSQYVEQIAAAVAEREQVIARIEAENDQLHERLAICGRERERLAAENAALREEVAARQAAAAHTDQTIGGAIFDVAGEIVAARQRGDVLNEDGKQYVRVEYKRAATHGIRSAQTNSKAVRKLKDSGHVPVMLRPVRIETEQFVGEVEAAYIEIPEEYCATPAKAALYLMPPPAPKKHGGARRKIELPDFGEEVQGPIEVKTEKKRIYRSVGEERVLKVEPLETHTEYCDPEGYQLTTDEVNAYRETKGLKIKVPAYRPQAGPTQLPLSPEDAALFDREDPSPQREGRPVPLYGHCAWGGCTLPALKDQPLCARHTATQGYTMTGAD